MTGYQALGAVSETAGYSRPAGTAVPTPPARSAELDALTRKLGQAQAELLQSQKLTAIGQLAAGIAHEINTPTQYVSDNLTFLQRAFKMVVDALTAARALERAVQAGADVTGPLEQATKALQNSKLDFMLEQIPEALSQSSAGLERVAKLVMAMKEFSHPSSGVLEPLDLGDIIQTTCTVARHEWRYVADLVTEFDPNLPNVPVLRDELGQVILNLVVNAAHAIGDVVKDREGEKGTILVSTHVKGRFAEIRIQDTGSGIPERARSHIFEPFFTTKPVGKGTGQGLAIAYGVVVEKHGGEMAFETQEGVGTTFIVRLPLDGAATARNQAEL